MTKSIRIYLILFILTGFFACNDITKKPIHFTDEFTFKDMRGKENKFYGFKNKDSAIFWAKKEDKHILVLFSGYACMAESGIEWRTLSYYGNNNKIQDKFILLWLAVDETTLLNDTIGHIDCFGPRRYLVTVGDKNTLWQALLTKTNTQPTMCFIDTNENPKGHLLHYGKDEQKLRNFIESGL